MVLRKHVRWSILFLVIVKAVGAQYVIDPEQSTTLPDTSLEVGRVNMPVSPNRLDVQALGMGSAHVASKGNYIQLSVNPALLASPARRFELVGLSASLPSSTLGAAMFVKNNASEFKGAFLKDINTAYGNFNGATNLADSLAALQDLRKALLFPNQVQKNLAGHTHGLSVVPNVGVQWNNWAATVHGTGQMGFIVQTGKTLEQLLTINIPEDATGLDEEAARTLDNALTGLFDEDGNPDPAALPEVFAVAYLDIVTTIGYGKTLYPNFDVGIALKVVNRRFSAKNISADALSGGVLGESISDFKTSVTGVTADLGLLYTFKNNATRLGVSVQNVFPISPLTSTSAFRSLEKEFYYADNGFGPYEDANGDTVLYTESRYYDIELPIQMTLPLLVNVGIQHPLMPNWDVAIEWADLLENDESYLENWHRIRIGTEYRILRGLLAFRGGIAGENTSIGAGLNLWLINFDAAYAYDGFIGDNSYFIQARIGL